MEIVYSTVATSISDGIFHPKTARKVIDIRLQNHYHKILKNLFPPICNLLIQPEYLHYIFIFHITYSSDMTWKSAPQEDGNFSSLDLSENNYDTFFEFWLPGRLHLSCKTNIQLFIANCRFWPFDMTFLIFHNCMQPVVINRTTKQQNDQEFFSTWSGSWVSSATPFPSPSSPGGDKS